MTSERPITEIALMFGFTDQRRFLEHIPQANRAVTARIPQATPQGPVGYSHPGFVLNGRPPKFGRRSHELLPLAND